MFCNPIAYGTNFRFYVFRMQFHRKIVKTREVFGEVEKKLKSKLDLSTVEKYLN
jgi:hypothetical protein